MRNSVLLKALVFSTSLLTSPLLLAGFATYSNDWPDDPCVVNEKVIKAPKTECKPDNNFLVITKEEQSKRLDDYKRLYAKLGMTFLTAQIRNIQNVSQPALSSGNVVNGSASENYVSWEFGLGTKFEYVRLELEYLYQKNIEYNPNPLFNTGTESLSSKLNTQSVWFDLMYDMSKLNLPYFTPYFGGLVGVCWNKTRSTLTGTIGNGAAQNHSRIALGWGVTVGARLPFWERWFGYLAYKYLDQGKVMWQDSTGVMQLKGHSVVQGVELGVQYLLG